MSAGEMWDELEQVREENRHLRAENERLMGVLKDFLSPTNYALQERKHREALAQKEVQS